jgi:hypothetical protein
MQPNIQLVLLAVLAAALIVLGVWIALRVSQHSPEKRERRRRLHINQVGRLGDALITEASDGFFYYTYSVQGVEYSASQDVSALREMLPEDPARLVGMAHLKYSPKNPANSILVCEGWSGLRVRSASPPSSDNLSSDAPPAT